MTDLRINLSLILFIMQHQVKCPKSKNNCLNIPWSRDNNFDKIDKYERRFVVGRITCMFLQKWGVGINFNFTASLPSLCNQSLSIENLATNKNLDYDLEIFWIMWRCLSFRMNSAPYICTFSNCYRLVVTKVGVRRGLVRGILKNVSSKELACFNLDLIFSSFKCKLWGLQFSSVYQFILKNLYLLMSYYVFWCYCSR